LLGSPVLQRAVDRPSTPTAGEKKSSYRPDIDGLRAVAVTSVVLFHAGLFPFNSGFVGVDIFFVISGYLIGGIILRGVADGTFRFADFYARRARRILPALLLVVTAATVAGWFLLDAGEYRGVGATSMSALLATSNFSFWAHQDYFQQDSRLSPLLMTCSLGVEEQFYVFFPIIMLLTMRWAPKRAVFALGLLTIGSFIFSAWSTTTYPATAFYLLPSRAWELGAGAMLAAWEIQRQSHPSRMDVQSMRFKHLLGATGLIALAVAIFALDPSLPFPGFLALLPVLGTVMLIASEGSLVNRRLLAARPVVFIGMISYSWYLWHWPVMSYVRIIAVTELPSWVMVLAGAAAFVLAYLSWRYVEQPFRHMRTRPWKTLLSYAGALSFALLITATIKYGQGLPLRLPDPAITIDATIEAGRGDCLASWTERSPDKSAGCLIKKKGQPSIALVGDSHAAALGPGIREIASHRNWGLWIFTKSSCGPLLDVAMPHNRMPFFADACKAFMTESLQTIAGNPDITTVLVAADWGSYAHLGTETLRAGLMRSLTLMQTAGKHVILIGDVPAWVLDPVHLELAKAMQLRGTLARLLWLDRDHPFPDNGISQMTLPEDPTITPLLRDVAQVGGADWLELQPQLCSPQGCTFERDGQLLYLDRTHLSVFGSRLVAATYHFPE
jgi:peptidoglycan/LPS O-acetylase OafA/YrhL